ncbi:MAG: DUF4097 domain-containing protein [Clostridiales bacterium]|nr:DUF4097 domain-containing protein [Clostridiales bacterium]
MSKTSKYLIICTFLIGIGIVLYIVGFLLGESVTGIGINGRGFQIYTWNHAKNNGVDYCEEDNIDLESFQNMDINIAYADLKIKESDHYGISYKVLKNSPLSYETKNGTLYVKQANNPTEISSFNWMFFGFNGLGDSSSYVNSLVTVYIPENAALDSISVSNECGNIELCSLNASSVFLFDDYGDVALTDINSPSISLDVNSGNLQMSNITTDTLSSNLDYGDFRMKQVTVNGNADITMESGSLYMGEIFVQTLKAESEYGDITAETLSAGDVYFSLESGSCELKDFVFDSVNASSDYGNVTLNVTAPVGDYSYDLYTDYGTVEIDDQDMGTKYKSLSSSNSAKHINVSCESGDIKIKGL